MLGQALDPGMKEGFGLFLGHGPGEGFGCLGPGSEQPPGDEGENGDQGIEQDEEKTDDGSKEKGQLVRMAGGVDLRVDFGKKKKDERRPARRRQDGRVPVWDQGGGQGRGQRGRGGIDEGVSDEDGREEIFKTRKDFFTRPARGEPFVSR
jgi:hypothetical protein